MTHGTTQGFGYRLNHRAGGEDKAVAHPKPLSRFLTMTQQLEQAAISTTHQQTQRALCVKITRKIPTPTLPFHLHPTLLCYFWTEPYSRYSDLHKYPGKEKRRPPSYSAVPARAFGTLPARDPKSRSLAKSCFLQ